MRAQELINKVRDIAINYKTLYVYACFGAPLNDANKKRYTNNCDYNRQPSRRNKILNASYDTFGFDCVNLIKGVLWGWNGDVNAIYGGAVYGSNGVPDTNANGMFWDCCYDQSNDFSNIIPGEFVWMEGHIGVYIGDGFVVECTPIWNDGVQITYLGNWGSKEGYAPRTWSSHGKSNFIDYSEEPKPEPTPEPEPTKFKIGDYVKTIKKGNGSSDGKSNSAAKGYKGTITNIINGAVFPYCVSDDEGPIGWYKEDALEFTEPNKPKKEIELGDTVIVNGVGTASSTGEGAKTRYFNNQEMKVIMISNNTDRPNRYALNQYNKGNINDPFAVTGWFSENDIKKK